MRHIYIILSLMLVITSLTLSYDDLEEKEIIENNIDKIVDNMDAIYSLLEGRPYMQNKITKHLSRIANYLEDIEEIYQLENIIMSDDSFDQLKESLKDTEFGEDRLNLLRITSKNNYFSSEQVASVIGTFELSGEKLEAVKILYPKILDVENIHYLFNSFEFSDDIEKLESIITEFEGE